MADIIKALEAKQNENIPTVKSGDNVSVHVKIKEGERERIQEFKGTVIRTRKGGNDAVHHRSPHGFQWHGRGAHIPAPLAAYRQDRRRTPQSGSPCAALLHARPHG